MKRNTILLLSVLAFAACNKLPEQGAVITIKAGIGPVTRVITDGNKAAFESGDEISVYAWTGSADVVPAKRVVDGVVNSFDGTKWTPDAQMLWFDKTTPHYFLGISPARSITDFTSDAFTIDPADYAASDLMVATNLGGLTSKDNPVSLSFDHVMAKLQVNLNFRNQWSGTPQVSAVTATAANGATVDYLSKTLTAGTAKTDVDLPALSAAAEGYALSFSGLMIPQDGCSTLTITVEGDDYVFTNTSPIPLSSGKVTVVNLIIGRDVIELDTEITINDWTNQGDAINGDVFKPEA